MSVFSDDFFLFRLPCNFLYPKNWIHAGFERALQYIEAHPELKQEQFRLSDHSGKDVWKMKLPPEAGGWTVAYKFCGGKKPWRYVMNLSLPAREFQNYQALYRFGIPAPRVLAIGEHRSWGFLRDSFIITEFVRDTEDGTCFMPGGSRRDDQALRDEFLERVLPLLARMHRNCFFHKAFHLRNLLWRRAPEGWLEVFFIDVARCRFRPAFLMQSAVVFDLRTLLMDLKLSPEENLRILECYLKYNPDCGMSLEQLGDRLRHFRRRWYGQSCSVLGD